MLLTVNKYADAVRHLSILSKKAGFVSCDIETNSLDWTTGKIVSLAFYGLIDGKQLSFHIPLNHNKYDCMSPEDFVRALNPFFRNAHNKIVFHNGNFDRHFIEQMGIHVGNHWVDTIVGYHLTNNEARLSLKDIANNEFGAELKKFKKIFDKRHPIEDSDPIEFEEYFFNDVFYTHKLARLVLKRLKEQNLERYFFEIEMPTYRVCYEMERLGSYIDVPKLKKIGEEVALKIEAAKRTIYELAEDPEFNPNSTPQMQRIVFDKFNAPVIKASKRTGKPSCDAATLETYSRSKRSTPELKKFCLSILEYREFSKIQSTYVQGILERLDSSGRIHPQFKMLTGTGRLSSADPNAQNIPSDPESYGNIIRECFIAPPEWRLIVFDYSQIELRIVAHCSQDPELLHAYKNNIDIHQRTADACGCSRKFAKVINFGLIYLMYYKSLAKKLGISDSEAETYVNNYFGTYKGVVKWQEKEIARGHKFKRTRTLLGRPRTLINIDSGDRWLREGAEREGVNHPIQGTAAELCKGAMIDCFRHRGLRALNAHLVMQVHDELMFRVPTKNVQKAMPIIKSLMENALGNRGVEFSVPIIAEGGYGRDWKHAKK